MADSKARARSQGEPAAERATVEALLGSLDPESLEDSRLLMALMARITGHEPRLWNVGTLGFDSYRFKYESGREGEGHVLGFYPRKGKITVYLMDGTARHAELLGQLGKHSTSRVCVYIQKLGDVRLPVLEQILRQSHAYLKSHDGRMHRVE